MQQCPECQTELSVEEKMAFTTCPKCNSLLSIEKYGIEKVDEHKMSKKNDKVNNLVKWVCSSILDHQWSDEGYVLSNDKLYCVKLRVCTRCFDTLGAHTRERHAFIEEYIKDDSCEKRRTCEKCGYNDIPGYPYHDFHYSYIEGTCTQEKKCSHCGLIESTTTQHAFSDDDWVLLDRTNCKSRHVCRRCGQVEEAIRHSGEWVVLEKKYLTPNGEEIFFREKRICEVCGFEETQERVWNSPYHN